MTGGSGIAGQRHILRERAVVMPNLRFAAPKEGRVARGNGGASALRTAEVVEFLASERNTYTTGSVWRVKGGTG
jgi:hypothetical protein